MSNIVENYGWSSERAPCSCGYIAPKVLDIVKDLNITRALDIGSGNGNLCSLLKSKGIDTVGVEYDKDGVEISKKKFPEIPFYNFGVQDDPSELLSEEDKFDAVVSTEVIEHLFSPHLLPKYAHEVLKENGYLIITTPYHGYLKNLILSIFDKWDNHLTPLWHGGHIKFWSEKTLTKLLEQNGFIVTNFYGVGRFAYMWKSMVLVAKKVS